MITGAGPATNSVFTTEGVHQLLTRRGENRCAAGVHAAEQPPESFWGARAGRLFYTSPARGFFRRATPADSFVLGAKQKKLLKKREKTNPPRSKTFPPVRARPPPLCFTRWTQRFRIVFITPRGRCAAQTVSRANSCQ